MRRIFVIAFWEWKQFLKTRRFWLVTFLAPVVAAALLLMPTYYYQTSQANQSQVIGCVSLDTTHYCEMLSDRLLAEMETNTRFGKLLIESIPPDTSDALRMDIIERDALKYALDSLYSAYDKVQERRQYLFSRPDSPTKTRLLRESYDELIATREQLDLSRETSKRLSVRVDTLMRRETLSKADSLLNTKRISGYIVINPPKFFDGKVEFHSRQPRNVASLQPLEHALQVLLVEERMRQSDFQVDKIQEMMRPVIIEEVLAEGSAKYRFSVRETYIAPVILLVCFLVVLLTTTMFLAISIHTEKSRRMAELIIASASTFQIVTGKSLGIWLLGIVQILAGTLVAGLLIQLNMLSSIAVPFLDWEYAGWFTLYYTFGYLLFGAWYITVGALSRRKSEMYRLLFVLNAVVLLPLALVVYVLFSPASILVRFLSYIPVFSPALMVIRTPIAPPPVMEYYITGTIMFIFILLGFSIAGKVFRNSNLDQSRLPVVQRLVALLQAR